MSRVFPIVLGTALFVQSISLDAAAAPEIQAVSVRGLQIDGTTTIQVNGSGLLPRPQLTLSVPIAKQVLKPGATATQVEFEVTLADDVEPGLYNLWLASGEGVSQPTVVAVDRLLQVPFAADVAALPVALHGSVSGSAKLRTTFPAKAGQALLIEVEAQRLGGKLRPVLHVFDSENRQIDWTLPLPTLRGDARLTFTPPADGSYTVELHDLQYAAPAPNFFRMKIGTWQYADLVFPPAVQSGTEAQLTLIGGSADGETVAFKAASDSAESVTSAPWKDIASATGFRPPILISEFPEVVEGPPTETPQKLPSVPSAVSGRLLAPGEQDRFQIDVVAGSQLRFEVFADQIGSPVDSALEILNEEGGRLAINDDAAGTPDSRIDYTVPANVTTLLLAVKDTNGRSGPDCIYRLAVTPLEVSGNQPDFQLNLPEQRHSVAAGNRIVIQVTANRIGYDGPIDLRFDSLPDGIQIQGATIAPGSSATLLTLHGAGADLAHSLTKLRGVATIDGRRIERIATVDDHVLAKLQPWLSGELGVAVAESSGSGFKADWGNVSSGAQLVLGGKLEIPVSAIRPPGFDGPVRLTLESSQLAVRAANNQVDANRTLRSETNQPIEIAADAEAQKAWDAKLAAEKVVADAKMNQAAVVASVRKAVVEAKAGLKTVLAQLEVVKEQAAKTAALSKTATDADAAAQKTLDATVAQLKAAAQAADQASAATLAEAAKAAADAAAIAKTAADQKAATGKALLEAAANEKKATDAGVAADKMTADAMAALKVAVDTAANAEAAEEAKVKDAEAKLNAADMTSKNASALAKNEGTFSIFVPADLKEAGYELALRAELLSRDKTRVIDRCDTSVRRFTTLTPIVVSLVDANRFVGQIDPQAGSTISISGKVERLAGMNQDVTVTLSGLPAGIAVPKAVVKPDQTDFKLDVVFPAAFKPAELNTVRIFATGKMRPNAPIDVRSEETALDIILESKPEPAKTP